MGATRRQRVARGIREFARIYDRVTEIRLVVPSPRSPGREPKRYEFRIRLGLPLGRMFFPEGAGGGRPRGGIVAVARDALGALAARPAVRTAREAASRRLGRRGPPGTPR